MRPLGSDKRASVETVAASIPATRRLIRLTICVIGVEHDGRIHEPRRARYAGDVCDPQPVRGLGLEASLDQIRRRTDPGLTTRGARPLATAHSGTPASRITRATRLRLTGMPSAASSA